MRREMLSQGLMKLGARLTLGAALAVLSLNLAAGSLAAQAAPAPAAANAPRPAPAATGPVSGTSCSPGCDLYAMPSTFTLPDGATTPIWGYSTSATPGSASLPGPLLEVTQGTAVTITLHNAGLPSATSLMIAGQPGIPDTTGVASGNSRVYSFPASGAGALKPGTYLYEAGLTADGPRQVAMGLYGALIVRPAGAPLQAYSSPSTAFTDEAVLVLSEIDPALNAAPLTFEMTGYAPKYWLINGKGYPNTDPITSTASSKVLLRYVNAGLQHHSMGLLGLHQTIVAADAYTSTNPLTVVAETVPTGGTLDTIVTIPVGAPADSRYAVFEAAMHLDNKGANTGGVINFGGMLTFINLGGASSGSGGPVTSNVLAAPNPSNGSANVALSATVTSASANVTAAEYFIDSLGADGTGTAMSGAFGGPSVGVTATLSVAQLSALSSGNHTLYVHGRDSNSVWGVPASTVLNLDKTGPAISNMSLTPSLTNGTADTQLQATASDAATGNQNVTTAEYFVDPVGSPVPGTGTPMTPSVSAPDVSLNVTIATGALSEGTHSIVVDAQDAVGNWGAPGSITLTVDKTGPATSGVVAKPNPTNGTIGVQVGTGGGFYERVDATISDTVSSSVSSKIVAAEYYFDTDPGAGHGGAMLPTDGSFSSSSEKVYGAIDLYVMSQLSTGNHSICVRGKDAAGNWGACATTTLVIDRSAPTVSGLALNPTASNNTAVAVSANATDVATGNSNIAGGEFFIDGAGTTGANGTGTTMTAGSAAPTATINGTISAATIAGLTPGNHTVTVHAKDVAGNWGPRISISTLLIDRTPPTFTSITLNPTTITTVTTSVHLTVNGATDPLFGGLASGVSGGEWFATTSPAGPTPPAGTGHAFSGLATDIPGTSFTRGIYTIRVRVRDVAGNWSTVVRTGTLTVDIPAPDLIFADGFESGNTSAWTVRVPAFGNARLAVNATAALVGTRGLQVQGNNTNYVQFNFGTFGNPAANTFDARFYFNPHGNTNTGQDIFQAATDGSYTSVLFRVRYQWNGGSPQVQIQTGANSSAWVNVTNNAANRIEVVWQAAGSGGPNPGTLSFYVGGVFQQSLPTASIGSVGSFRMGSVTSGASATAEYFDAVSSKRSVSPLIGP